LAPYSAFAVDHFQTATAQGGPPMSKDDKLWFVIAAFNEGSMIMDVVRRVTPMAHVVVVDDGSSDDTGDLSLEAGAHVATHMINRGQGAALQTGIDYALAQGAEHIVTFDADGQHDADEALAMVEVCRAEGLDVVLGSRFLGKAVNMPTSRRLTLKAAVLFTRLTTGLKLTDAHNGLRVLSRNAAQRIRIHQDRMAHASEILSLIGKHKIAYREFPVTITYSEYSLAKGQKISNSVRILEDIMLGGHK
jgi:glycosyltransferase involved in cell wall biosynthesis